MGRYSSVKFGNVMEYERKKKTVYNAAVMAIIETLFALLCLLIIHFQILVALLLVESHEYIKAFLPVIQM